MKKLLVGIVIASILLLPAMALAEGTELSKEDKGVEVLKLPYGVTVGLMPDQELSQVWYRTFNFDISQNLNTRVLRSYIGFSTGNFITDFSVGYTREFGEELEEDDQGIASFSFTWNF